jgi:hypothetical protein
MLKRSGASNRGSGKALVLCAQNLLGEAAYE